MIRNKILSKGEEKTQQLNNKIKEHSKKMMDFSSDGMNVSIHMTSSLFYSCSNSIWHEKIWNFDGVDYSQPGQKKYNPMFWIEPAKRERKTKYEYIDNANINVHRLLTVILQ